MTEWELQAVFFAAGARWSTHWNLSYDELARLVWDQIDVLGWSTVRDIGARIKAAVDGCQWREWEALLPGLDHRGDAMALAAKFIRMHRRATRSDAALTAWHQALTTAPSGVAA
ncbi:hypothetical protein M3G91_12755 [Micromonospora chalcea]|uniref:hypothetical protein n=1 Tax=Micromonospora chalcea TaxID=1874 RepID=UPI0021A28142|nr:hypothetical protein [Micromonospora chalcea]MCT2278487.1 hypothetical protein [Micromonospora chalcea]